MALFVVACAQNNVNSQNAQQPQTISAGQFKKAIEKPNCKF